MLYSIILIPLAIAIIVLSCRLLNSMSCCIHKKSSLSEFIIGILTITAGISLPVILIAWSANSSGFYSVSIGLPISCTMFTLGIVLPIMLLFIPDGFEVPRFNVWGSFLIAASLILFLSSVDGSVSYYEAILLCGILFAFIFTAFTYCFRQMYSANTSRSLPDTILNLGRFTFGTIGIPCGISLLLAKLTELFPVIGVNSSLSLIISIISLHLAQLIFIYYLTAKKHIFVIGGTIGSAIVFLTIPVSLTNLASPLKSALIDSRPVMLDIPIMLILVGILTLPVMFCKKLERWQGIVMFLVYLTYLSFIFKM